jgi:hypothetical protein
MQASPGKIEPAEKPLVRGERAFLRPFQGLYRIMPAPQCFRLGYSLSLLAELGPARRPEFCKLLLVGLSSLLRASSPPPPARGCDAGCS